MACVFMYLMIYMLNATFENLYQIKITEPSFTQYETKKIIRNTLTVVNIIMYVIENVREREREIIVYLAQTFHKITNITVSNITIKLIKKYEIQPRSNKSL